MALRVHFSRKAGVGLREKILLLSGYGQGERLLPGLTGALEQAGSLRRLEAGADTGQAREAYARMTGGSGRGVAVGVGAGCVQALLLAQAFPLDALACLLPGAGEEVISSIEAGVALVGGAEQFIRDHRAHPGIGGTEGTLGTSNLPGCSGAG